VTLNVIVPQTKILGESDVFVKSGSSVVIKCVITESLEEPDYIFWYHDGGRVLSVGTGVKQANSYTHVERLSGDTTLGMLVIKATQRQDSGNYTCAPSNLETASINLHVLQGEYLVTSDLLEL
jgi:neurotrimin